MTLTQAGLFEGYGGLSIAVAEVLGAELTWYSEIEPAACRLLTQHHPNVPNVGDVSIVDWSAVERPDVLTGGFPCQDVSSAGRRAGMKPDTRSGLWNHMATAIDMLRPRLVVIENVRGLLSAHADSAMEPCPWCVGNGPGNGLRALGAVLGDLVDLGYDARWCGLRAADVGAPHGRFRIFITAWPAADADGHRYEGAGPAGSAPRDERRLANASTSDASDAPSFRRGEGRAESAWLVGGPDAASGCDVAPPDSDGIGPLRSGEPRGRWGRSAHDDRVVADPGHGAGHGERARPEPRAGGEAPADPHACRRERAPHAGWRSSGGGPAAGRSDVAWGDYEPAIRRWEQALGRAAPAPTMTGKRGGQQLSPRFVEWMQGLPEGHVTAVPGLPRNEQLKLLGNGVVSQQAAAALRYLLDVRSVERAA